jgi:ABC-type nitrate/sulfonate/bicarbonate transport system permease component
MSRLTSRFNWLGFSTFFGFIVLWELLIRLKLISFDYVPPPSEVFVAARDLILNGEMQLNLQHTLTAALVGWIIASVVGVILGVLLAVLRPMWTYSMASVDALRSLPIVAFVPVAVLLFGFSLQMEIVLSFYGALWPVLLNTFAGMRDVEPRLLEVGRVMRLSKASRIWKLQLPSATSHIVVGMRLGLAISLVLTLVAEMVGNPAGLGFALVQAAQALQPAQMFAYIVAIGVSGIILNAGLIRVARLLFSGQMASSGESK